MTSCAAVVRWAARPAPPPRSPLPSLFLLDGRDTARYCSTADLPLLRGLLGGPRLFGRPPPSGDGSSKCDRRSILVGETRPCDRDVAWGSTGPPGPQVHPRHRLAKRSHPPCRDSRLFQASAGISVSVQYLQHKSRTAGVSSRQTDPRVRFGWAGSRCFRVCRLGPTPDFPTPRRLSRRLSGPLGLRSAPDQSALLGGPWSYVVNSALSRLPSGVLRRAVGVLLERAATPEARGPRPGRHVRAPHGMVGKIRRNTVYCVANA